MTETTLTIRDTRFGIYASGFGCARYSEEDFLNVTVRLLKKMSDGGFAKLVGDLRSGFSPVSLEKQAVAEVVEGWSNPRNTLISRYCCVRPEQPEEKA